MAAAPTPPVQSKIETLSMRCKWPPMKSKSNTNPLETEHSEWNRPMCVWGLCSLRYCIHDPVDVFPSKSKRTVRIPMEILFCCESTYHFAAVPNFTRSLNTDVISPRIRRQMMWLRWWFVLFQLTAKTRTFVYSMIFIYLCNLCDDLIWMEIRWQHMPKQHTPPILLRQRWCFCCFVYLYDWMRATMTCTLALGWKYKLSLFTNGTGLTTDTGVQLCTYLWSARKHNDKRVRRSGGKRRKYRWIVDSIFGIWTSRITCWRQWSLSFTAMNIWCMNSVCFECVFFTINGSTGSHVNENLLNYEIAIFFFFFFFINKIKWYQISNYNTFQFNYKSLGKYMSLYIFFKEWKWKW